MRGWGIDCGRWSGSVENVEEAMCIVLDAALVATPILVSNAFRKGINLEVIFDVDGEDV